MSAAVTTVVATRDRWTELSWSLRRHVGPVILVDNGSSDATPVRVRAAFPQVRVIEAGTNLGAPARNLGVAAATTPYVAFADDDSWWEPGALDVAASLFDRHPRLGLIGGRILVGAKDRPDPVCAEMEVSPLGPALDLPGISILGFLACGAFVRREAFLGAGGFDPVVHWAGEEERLALDLAAAGWGISYVDTVIAHHHPSSTRAPSDWRRAMENRNELLTAVMRRPWPMVWRTITRLSRRDRTGRAGLLRAVPRLPRALAWRRALPPDVEAARRLLDG